MDLSPYDIEGIYQIGTSSTYVQLSTLMDSLDPISIRVIEMTRYSPNGGNGEKIIDLGSFSLRRARQFLQSLNVKLIDARHLNDLRYQFRESHSNKKIY